jgi:uncharacterized protein (DUF58 family)
MTAPSSPYAEAAALRRLRLWVGRRLDGLLQGEHLTPLPGPGSEAADARPYAPGDDPRRIDWSATARTGETQVRTTAAERELETWVLADLSASMDFGTVRFTKRDLAVGAVAGIAHLTEGPGNRLGAVLLAGDSASVVPARTGRGAQLALLRALAVADRAAEGVVTPTLAAGLARLERPQRRRGLVVVVSDLLGEPAAWERSLRRLCLRHEVLVVQIADPRELELPAVGVLRLVDPETGRRLEVQTSSRRLRERYAAAARERRAAIAEAVRRAGAGHVPLRTDRDWVLDLARHVANRRRLRPQLVAAR